MSRRNTRPGRHDVDRRLLLEHGPDLHRRRVGPEHGAPFVPRRAVVDEQRVELATGRVPLAHVERFEVVPVGLDLRTFGDPETQPDEHVFEPLPRLGDEVGSTTGRFADVLGQVDPLGLDLCGEFDLGEFDSALLERGGHRLHGLVDGSARRLLLVDGLEATETRLELGELALLAEQLGVERGHRLEGVGGGDLCERCVTGSADVVDHGSPFNTTRLRVRTSPRADSGAGAQAVQRRRPRAVHPGRRNRRAVVTGSG